MGGPARVIEKEETSGKNAEMGENQQSSPEGELELSVVKQCDG